MAIDSMGDSPIDLRGDELERYAERSAYGCFYRVPYNLRRGNSAAVSAEVNVFHPVRSEEILVSYYPCTDYTATVRLPAKDAKRFQLRVEFWHPSRPGEWTAEHSLNQNGLRRKYLQDYRAVASVSGLEDRLAISVSSAANYPAKALLKAGHLLPFVLEFDVQGRR